jgi:putative NADH-flavin reductase
MRIVLLGATGFVGSALLVEALHRGHKVTAIVRHPEKLEKRDGLTATAGDVYDTDSLASLIACHDALISAFNPGWTPGTVKPEMYDEQVLGTSSIIAAARKAGIKRVLWVGGAGGLEVRPIKRCCDPGSPRQTAGLRGVCGCQAFGERAGSCGWQPGRVPVSRIQNRRAAISFRSNRRACHPCKA